MTATASETLALLTDDAKDETRDADRELLREIESLRLDLDRIVEAVAVGARVYASVGGTPHVDGSARDVSNAIRNRQAAYDKVALLDRIADRVAKAEAAESTPRFYTTVVSVGDAGLTQRPAVIDRDGYEGRGKTVKVFRSNEQHLADALAENLNAREGGA